MTENKGLFGRLAAPALGKFFRRDVDAARAGLPEAFVEVDSDLVTVDSSCSANGCDDFVVTEAGLEVVSGGAAAVEVEAVEAVEAVEVEETVEVEAVEVEADDAAFGFEGEVEADPEEAPARRGRPRKTQGG